MRGKLVLQFGVLALIGLVASSGPTWAQESVTDRALEHVRQNADAYGLSQADLDDVVVINHYRTRHNGLTHVYLQQQFRGIAVHNAIINVNIDRAGRVLSVGNRFVPNLAKAIRGATRALEAPGAAERAARHLGLEPTEAVVVRERRSDNDVLLSRGGVSLEGIPARLVYLQAETGEINLAWSVGIYTKDGQHYWNLFIDAATGAVLQQDDLVIQDLFDTEYGASGSFMEEVRRATSTVSPLLVDVFDEPLTSAGAPASGAYRVYPLPVESPNHAGDPSTDLRSLVSSPSDPTASPLGWHSDGSNSYTVTRGNNVHAYTDVDADGIPDPGSSPDGGGGLVFDYPLDLSAEPESYRPAAVTNLFYWNNVIHDITYQYGFDEAAGNFQVNNFGKGGLGGDDVRAEAQDGSGTNNANFLTLEDGMRPRMQMFRWSAPRQVTVNEPSPIAGDYTARQAAFGPAVTTAGISGDVELVDDGTGASVTDGCEALIGFTAGNIALIDRGACSFVTKIRNAQNAGAIAVTMANNVPGGPITMGDDGTGGDIVIPSVMVSLDNGTLFKANLPLNVTIESTDPDRDSDFDNGIIVHEYGHGISNRLTGGPLNLRCLVNAEQMGEGWSDYLGLMLTDTNTDNRGIATYVVFEPTSGTGIRPTVYSTSAAVDPATYASVADVLNISQPHGIGYVWATMLWDMTRSLVQRHGFDADLYNGSGGNNLAIQLVTDGMKIQPCRPGFVDGRDAILTADVALTGGANQCLIWDAFANRGLGFSADQGSTRSRLDGVEAFDFPDSCCTLATLNGTIDGLESDGTLSDAQHASLSAQLALAESQAAGGDYGGATATMNAFIAEVNALKASGVLTADQRRDIVNCARGVLNRFAQAAAAAPEPDASEFAKSVAASSEVLPEQYALDQNYPNPFVATTEIQFALTEGSSVRLVVYDAMGREVTRLVDGELPGGFHRVTLDGRGLASGIYFYRIEAGEFVDSKRMVLLK